MKRYVKEVASDCKRELKSSMQFALDAGHFYGTLTEKDEEEIRKEYAKKLERIDEITNQCEYGYIPELQAVEYILKV